MNITIDGLDTVKQLPWIGDRILKINYDFEGGDLIAYATHTDPDQYSDDVMVIIWVCDDLTDEELDLKSSQLADLEQYILDQYHS